MKAKRERKDHGDEKMRRSIYDKCEVVLFVPVFLYCVAFAVITIFLQIVVACVLGLRNVVRKSKFQC